MKRKVRGMAGARIGILLAVCLCCMTGCGQGGAGEEGSNTGTAAAGAAEGEEKADFDLAAEQWTEPGAAEDSGETWTLVEYKEDFGQKAPDKGMTRASDRSASDGFDYYTLEYYFKWNQAGEVIQKYYLTHVDMQTLESQRAELTLSGEGQEKSAGLTEDLAEGHADIAGMDALGGKVCLLVRQRDRESGVLSHCYAIRLDEQWKVESAVDLLPGLEKAGMCRGDRQPEGILCDGEGRFYIGTEEYGIFDNTGEFLKMLEVPGGNGSQVRHTCRLPDGRPVFETLNIENRETVFFCQDGPEQKVLYRGTCDYAETRYMNAKGEIFYFGREGLSRWDASTGKCECIYRDSSLNSRSCQTIAEAEEDTLMLAFYDNGENFVLRLRRDADLKEKTVTLYSIYQMSEYDTIVQHADAYCRTHPGVKIEFVTVKEESDDHAMALARLVARMTAGEKPDIFLADSEDLEILQDKGALADLQELLPGELQEQIFPGVLKAGMVGDKLCGIASEVSVNTIAVSKDVWPADTWSFRDVMALVEGENAAGDFTGVFGGRTQELLLADLVLWDIMAGRSSLVDLDGKECYFDSEEFIRVLEFCKKYGLASEDRDKTTFQEIMEGIHNGNILAYSVGGNLKIFSRDMAELGDGFHCVGFPTEGSYGGSVDCHEYIAMNAAGENQEEAIDFIQYMLSERVQRSIGISTVRRDVLTDNVMDVNTESEGFWMYQSPVFQTNDRTIIPLDGKPDGSSFLPEYLEILEKADYMAPQIDDLGMMIIEEAGGFFSGDMSAEQVARTIQSRVWVYLNE
ncbi:MAG: ABC transporter substrate-binding protein [Acetatifactor sp.]|nr:ABC transporter substrate-binding protein [Acetatifactor sp.]